ncbi:MAG TPA: hypothetical protein VGC77_19645 [Rhodopseudomonas sp.]|uniref:hypothetical protein n=1 Tax=Rhodopseudomonas sp. TaxID=1078 RepID=UPI002ED9C64D
MAVDKTVAQPAPDAAPGTGAMPSAEAVFAWWTDRPAAFGELMSGVLAQTEALMRRQADFVGELSRCKQISDVASVQTRFVQDAWSEAGRDAQAAFAKLRGAFLPTSET